MAIQEPTRVERRATPNPGSGAHSGRGPAAGRPARAFVGSGASMSGGTGGALTPRGRRASRELGRGAATTFFTPVLSLGLFAGLIYAVWEAVCLAGLAPGYILPTPLTVAQEFVYELGSGDLTSNAGVTLQEALFGFVIAVAVAGLCGYVIAHVRLLDALATPFIAASQAVPIQAVAPIIILLLGVGLAPKVFISALIAVFPLLINTITGLRGVGRDYHDVARVFGASRLQTLWYLELPLAAPVLFSGLKIGLTLSLTGALVGEFLAADAGLGFMINTANSGSDAAKSFVGLITTVLLSVFLFGLVTIAERTTVRWLDVQP